MPAYLIADITIQKPDVFAEYRKQVPASVEKYGGRFLTRGGDHLVLEGDWRPSRVVVIEFPDMTAAKAWYGSAEYQPLIKLRQSASTGPLILVEGA
ncbi:MAG TPA: DUF1330 domain-containing protein [Candidatus Methylomirabilis sp.]|nr:DUF1330 domain-containing protein [Candidatus Methylomirabilis sp.]